VFIIGDESALLAVAIETIQCAVRLEIKLSTIILMREYEIKVIDDLSDVPPADWDTLAGNNPTLKHAFLQSMIDADCTTAKSGWLPQFITLWREVAGKNILAGAVPLYMKGHSYGEYVFDWAWAEAYHRAGLEYYPKLLAAVPFTPCSGARLMAGTDADRHLLIQGLLEITRQSEVSSVHVLFPAEMEHAALIEAGFMPRTSVSLAKCGLSKLRCIPRHDEPRQAKEGKTGAQKSSRSRHHVRT
jgi:predicted N-acyltransferase